ncbi:cytochrome c oxidase assembly factor CtaG [Hydrogenophaga palleronii]|uniref:Cytochrome c oxidase assembly factor CtaG n=1 Tax=Hydrogenophaga palleronii TaxID=65655 RepID=A0ABU1WNS6_9BURK|nr:cytochrome c oxidase assembly protein [Hydrogenophaga palleronii]MDR7150697.1 cytochrome c oxidase assembly factor CtaG [Hydrogenophaga palleronii]
MCVKTRTRGDTGWAMAACLASLCAWPSAGLAHGVEGGASQAPVWFTQALFLLAWLMYALGAVRQRPRFGPRLALHSAMLVAGLALFGPLDEWSERSAAWHMVQHMLLMVVVAPLLVLARPLPQWRAVLGARADAAWRTLHRLSRRPMACAMLHAVAIWFWHLPGPYLAALASPLWHVTEHACFLLSGWLFWWSVLRPGRAHTLAAAGALLFTVMHTGMLGALLVFAHLPLYSEAQSAMADQQMAGLVMWVPGGLVYLLVTVWAGSRWLGSLEATPLGRAQASPRR